MDLKIRPRNLKGSLKVPPSKSGSHRAIISAGLAAGKSRIDNIIFSKDILATLNAMMSLGVKYKITEPQSRFGTGSISIEGVEDVKIIEDIIDADESGSTLRFLIPLAARDNEKVVFTGKGKLVERPLDTYYQIFDEQGIKYDTNEGKLPLTVNGGLKSGKFNIAGNISSQFITGLLFSLPLLEGDSTINLTSPLESKGYVDLTIQMLDLFGIEIDNKDYERFIVKGGQKYKNRDYTVEGDFSQAAFHIVAGILGEEVKCRGLNINSLQGDKAILDIVKKMGADIVVKEDVITTKNSKTHGIEIDASQCPDLVPILATLGALSSGTTRIVKAERLRIKESDRLKAMATELRKLGADIVEFEDGLEIRGKDKLTGGIVDSWNDHRIAMALAIASIRCSGDVIIKNTQAVNKSYPGFWNDFKSLGGKIDEWNMG